MAKTMMSRAVARGGRLCIVTVPMGPADPFGDLALERVEDACCTGMPAGYPYERLYVDDWAEEQP